MAAHNKAEPSLAGASAGGVVAELAGHYIQGTHIRIQGVNSVAAWQDNRIALDSIVVGLLAKSSAEYSYAEVDTVQAAASHSLVIRHIETLVQRAAQLDILLQAA